MINPKSYTILAIETSIYSVAKGTPSSHCGEKETNHAATPV